MSDRILQGGGRVIGLDNLSTGNHSNLSHLIEEPDFRFQLQDVTEPFEVAQPLDYVMHLASPASPRDYLRLPIETLKAGAIGTEHALEIAASHSARFVLLSTSEVYGDAQEHPQKETYWGSVNPVGPRSVYDEAKRYAEALTMAHRRVYGTDVSIARVFNTYGPRMRISDGRAVPEFATAALRGESLPIHGDGMQTRSLCYVSDLVEGLSRLMLSDLTGPVNLGGSDEVSVLEIARTIQAVVGTGTGFEFLPRPVDDPTRRCPDTSLALDNLGWETTVTLADGLALTIDWIRSQLEEDEAAVALDQPA